MGGHVKREVWMAIRERLGVLVFLAIIVVLLVALGCHRDRSVDSAVLDPPPCGAPPTVEPPVVICRDWAGLAANRQFYEWETQRPKSLEYRICFVAGHCFYNVPAPLCRL